MTRSWSWSRAKQDFINEYPHPGDDPAARLRHVNDVFADVGDPESWAVMATCGMYPEGQTGLSFADLRAIEAELSRLRAIGGES